MKNHSLDEIYRGIHPALGNIGILYWNSIVDKTPTTPLVLYGDTVSCELFRQRFENNNIQGFRGGQKAVCLVYQGKVVMSYIIGRCFFAKKPSYEIIRGATLLGCTVVGGASKLWNYITNKWDDLPILYYIDFNYFNGSSMLSLKGLEYIGTTPSFKNWWRVHWKTGEKNVIRNREPMHHKEVIEAQKRGLGWPIYNAGTKTYIYTPKK